MSDMDINQVLAQMRVLSAQAQSRPAESAAQATQGVDFGAMLKQSIEQVNSLQQEASGLAQNFELGDPNTDLTQVMVALQKASVAFQAMTQVRNKLVSAYQDIMNMPI
jgi:flagellar hook-basal body complex protein FliE